MLPVVIGGLVDARDRKARGAVAVTPFQANPPIPRCRKVASLMAVLLVPIPMGISSREGETERAGPSVTWEPALGDSSWSMLQRQTRP